ncbi:MAG: SIMPL domain-containing protein [bacterium]
MNKISTRAKSSTSGHKLILEPVIFMLTILFAALSIYVVSLAYYSIKNSDAYYAGTITVSGHGEIEITPDIQKLTVEILPSTATSTNVDTSSNDYAKKVITYLKSKGIRDADMKIVSARSVEVKLRGSNMDSAKTISSDLEKISPKRISVDLSTPEVENQDLLKSEALEMALNNAKMNALKVSNSLGADLGKVISFYDNNTNGTENFDPTLATYDISVTFQTR